MNDYKKGRNAGKGPQKYAKRGPATNSFGPKKFGTKNAPSTLHETNCSSCGRDCQVPFRPMGDKPVYCNTCFKKDNARSKNNQPRSFTKDSFKPDNFKRPSSGMTSEQFEILNAKLDKILDLL